MNHSIAYGILTHNAISYLRLDLLEKTINSLEFAFPSCPRIILDNCSVDGTCEHISSLDGGLCYCSHDGDSTPGRGDTVLVNHLIELGTDIIVISDDDIEWGPEAKDQIVSFWSSAPSEVIVLCCMLEPIWHWNKPISTLECGGVKTVLRSSAPTAAWTFKSSNWSQIGPFDDGFGHDYKKCQQLINKGFQIAQVDLAKHIGWGYSSHDNRAIETAKQFNKKEWGLE